MSNIRAGTISGVNGTDPVTLTKQSAAKAWMTMVGDGTSIDDSFNTSSVTDGAARDYTQSYTNSFGDDDYSWCGQSVSGFSGTMIICVHVYSGKTPSQTRLFTVSSGGGSNTDTNEVCSIIHGELA